MGNNNNDPAATPINNSRQTGGGGSATNQCGREKGGTRQPTTPAPKGMVAALGNHVFDYGQGKTSELFKLQQTIKLFKQANDAPQL